MGVSEVIDRAVETVNPSAALRRKRDRIQLSYINSVLNSGYSESGASHEKTSMKSWNATSESPQRDIDENLATLRKRSRSLIMNAPVARSAVNIKRTNTVGAGLRVKPKIDYEYLGMQREEADRLKKEIEREFNFWASSKLCDSSGQNDFFELQQIAFYSWMSNGECFIIPRYGEKERQMPYQLRIRLIEADRISDPNTYGEDYVYMKRVNPKTKNKIVNGIEIDDNGKVAAYFICNGYPNDDMVKEWVRVEAYGKNTGNPNILHLYSAERAEQYRGVPMLAPVIETVKQLTRYSEAEIMAAVINGLFAVMITTQAGTGNVDFGGEDEEEEEQQKNREINLGNGTINYLGPGESVEMVDAKRPNVNFDSFTSSLCKYIGAALEIPYDVLMMCFNASYSASRAAMMQLWKSIEMCRSWFVADFCQPIYELFLSEAVATGRIHCPGFFLDPLIRYAYCKSQWSGPSIGQLDPVKEAEGAILRINNGLSTREKEAIGINGTDFDENINQLMIENQKMKEAFEEEGESDGTD